jgi:hypothetical protein
MVNHENRPSGAPAPPHEHPHAKPETSSQSVGSMSDDTEAQDRFTDSNDQPKGHLSNLAPVARDQTPRLASEVKDQTAQLASQAGEQVSRLMTEQKNRAADGLHRLAGVLRDTARNRGQNDVGGQIANYTNRAAARMDSMSIYIRGADFPTILRDAGQFARRRPEVLLGVTILTGLLAARFLKASRRGAAEPWTSAAGRWHEALQKGTQVVSAAADTLKQGAEARGLSPAAVVEKVTESRLGKHVAIAANRHWGKS